MPTTVLGNSYLKTDEAGPALTELSAGGRDGGGRQTSVKDEVVGNGFPLLSKVGPCSPAILLIGIYPNV